MIGVASLRGCGSGRGAELTCGIVGIIGRQEVAPLLIEGLRRLEYRGYDSVGIATLIDGRIGIAHTRWATHGVPNETNAHPVATDGEARADRGAGTVR